MMKHSEINDLLTAYEVDVRFPDVSGMEHLDMLLVRSELAKAEHGSALTVEQTRRLAEADRILAGQAGRFYQAIRRIADLESWRQQEGSPPQEWWWYLDVLAQVPTNATVELAAVAA
jgi:hypothetical protein